MRGESPSGLSDVRAAAGGAERSVPSRPHGAVAAVYPARAQLALPPSVQEVTVLVVDGKAIKRVAKRLKPLRGRKGGV
jgi:hypothetical protein